jgi:hypothetical protein
MHRERREMLTKFQSEDGKITFKEIVVKESVD